MKEEIKKAIGEFSKGNKELAKILAIYSAKLIIIFGKNLAQNMNEELLKLNKELLEASEGLINYFDVNK